MTDNEIIKALECWINDFAGKATQFVSLCNALALINRQKEEIDEYQKHIDNDIIYVKAVKAEAVKEFAERLKAGAVLDDDLLWVTDVDIDNLVKEFTEGDQHVRNT